MLLSSIALSVTAYGQMEDSLRILKAEMSHMTNAEIAWAIPRLLPMRITELEVFNKGNELINYSDELSDKEKACFLTAALIDFKQLEKCSYDESLVCLFFQGFSGQPGETIDLSITGMIGEFAKEVYLDNKKVEIDSPGSTFFNQEIKLTSGENTIPVKIVGKGGCFIKRTMEFSLDKRKD